MAQIYLNFKSDYFSAGKAIVAEFTSNTGKKPLEKKLEEAHQYLLEEKDITVHLTKGKFEKRLIEDGQFAQLVGFVLKTCINRQSNSDFIETFIDLLEENTDRTLTDDVYEESAVLIANPYTQRMVSNLALVLKSNQN